MKRDGEEDPVIVLDSDNEEPANSEHEGVRPLPAIVVDEEDNSGAPVEVTSVNADEGGDDDELTLLRQSNIRVPRRQISTPVAYINLDDEAAHHDASDDIEFLGGNLVPDAGDNDEDAVTLLEERLADGLVPLNLPGGRRIIVNAANGEAPVRSSFERLMRNNQLRYLRTVPAERQNQRVQRNYRPVRNDGMFVPESDDSQDDEWETPDLSSGYQSSASNYPSRPSSALINDWAIARARNAARRRTRAMTESRISAALGQLAGLSGSDLVNGYINFPVLPQSMASYMHNHVYGTPITGSEDDEEAQTQSIIDIIQQREESERDKRVKEYTRKSESQKKKFYEEAKQLPPGYSASFATPEVIRENDDEDNSNNDDDEDMIVCNLCGVELGIGIPEEFTGISKEDFALSFAELMDKYGSRCPYQSLGKPSELDRDLSKRTYVSNCSHLFCGRCWRRYLNARSLMKTKAGKSLNVKLGASHPDNFAPKVCPADNCKYQIRSKGKMREVYF